HIPTARRRSFLAMMQDLCTQYLHTDFPEPEAQEENVQGDLFAEEPSVDIEYAALTARYLQELTLALDMDLRQQNQLKLYEEIELP
ncbi:hypothetical protein IR117_02200, partial [Streptococcus danieliae]|nr:hypothetical protein [Streptococcus danieliae]